MVRHRGAIVIGATAAMAAGLIVARRFSPTARLNRMLNGNWRLLTVTEKRQVRMLAAMPKRRYILSGWPRPGIADGAKRQLIAKAAADAPDTESERLNLLQAPLASVVPRSLEHHGDVRIDEFYWLRDDERADQKVIGHIEAENAYTRAVLADTETLQEDLYKEMRARIQEADRSAPQRHKGFWYYSRTEEGQQYRVHCRRRAAETSFSSSSYSSLSKATSTQQGVESDTMDETIPEEILLDENVESKGHAFYMVGGFDVSPDHRLLAYGVDTVGNESYTLYVKDLETGKQILSRPILETAGSFAWAADCKTLFYVTKDKLDRPYKVWRHVIGTDPDADKLVFHEEDEAFYVGIGVSRSEKIIYIHSGSAVTSDIRMLPADDPMGEWRLVLPRKNDVEYSVDDRGDQLFITVRDASRPNSELLVAPLQDPSDASPLLPHRVDVKLEGVALSRDYLVAFERENGLQQAVVHRLPADGASVATSPLTGGQPIAFDEPAYELSPGSQGDFDSPLLRFHYTSLTTPDTVYDFHCATGQRAIKKVQPVLGGFDKTKYRTERLWATAPDGVKVPVSIVYRTDLAKLDGTDALLLDAYGSYEIPNDADFRSTRLSLLDRGVTFAIAHVRGGGEMGRNWYEDGKLQRKQNTFTDFIACSQLLIDTKYTSPQTLAIEGRSAGGLTMGAVTNLRPDMFNAVILGVPFVDCLTTMLDETIPLTTIEWEEWGNPKESKEAYEYIKSYSPVDNLKPGVEYPNMLITAGLHDPRVGYWEPAKLLAKLRKLQAERADVAGDGGGRGTRQRVQLLKCEMGAGHFSQSGRFDKLKEIAVEHAFLLKCLGMLDVPLKPSATA